MILHHTVSCTSCGFTSCTWKVWLQQSCSMKDLAYQAKILLTLTVYIWLLWHKWQLQLTILSTSFTSVHKNTCLHKLALGSSIFLQRHVFTQCYIWAWDHDLCLRSLWGDPEIPTAPLIILPTVPRQGDGKASQMLNSWSSPRTGPSLHSPFAACQNIGMK